MLKIASASILLAAAGSAFAQGQTGAPSITLPTSVYGLSLSTQCQGAVLNVLTNSAFAQCFPVADLLPLVSSSSSIIPYLDKFMTDLCYNYPVCNQTTLQAAAQTIIAGCSSDLQKDGFSNQVVTDAFNTYPVVREVLCLKTNDPYTAQSYGGFLGAPAIPIVGNSAYNATNGTFCVTSVATQLSAYMGANITVPYIAGIVTGQNNTALNLAKNINPNIICNNCLFAALEVVDLVAPVVGKTPVAAITGVLGVSAPSLGNTTIDQFFNATCAYKPLALTVDGQLPSGITVSIINSTYPVPIKSGQTMMSRALFGRKVSA